MRINLFHNSYNETHLNEVKEIMVKRGAPKIRAIWSEIHGEWLAVEGCHRLRAAEQLGLTPQIIDISNQKTVTIQIDDEMVKVKVAELAEELNDTAHRRHSIKF